MNGISIPIFALAKQQQLRDESIQHLKESAEWIVRGLVESKPILGNGIVWSYDSL